MLSQSEVGDGIKKNQNTKNKQSQKTVKLSNLVAKGKEALEGAGSCGMDFRTFPWERTFQASVSRSDYVLCWITL